MHTRPPLWSSGQSAWLQIAFSVKYELNLIRYVGESRPPLWSSGQSSWLQIAFPVKYEQNLICYV
jgi:hypothetical protein